MSLRRVLLLALAVMLLAPASWAAKFIVGDRVACNSVDAGCLTRSTPGGARLTSHNPGDAGTVLAGPTNNGGFDWWQINFDTGDDGWFTEPNLDKIIVASIPGSPGRPVVTLKPSPIFGSALVGWQANTEIDLAGYRVYMGTKSKTYTSSSTIAKDRITATANNLVPGQTYFFAITAFDNSNNESPWSKELSKTIP